jgi:peroxin-5
VRAHRLCYLPSTLTVDLKRYDEAAAQILNALVLQDSDTVHDAKGMNDARGVTSTALWDSLKTACIQMQQADLAALCDMRNLSGIFHQCYH